MVKNNQERNEANPDLSDLVDFRFVVDGDIHHLEGSGR